jgi:hypothetical protein
MIQWLAFILHIQEVPGSDVDLEAGYTGQSCMWFSSVPPSRQMPE